GGKSVSICYDQRVEQRSRNELSRQLRPALVHSAGQPVHALQDRQRAAQVRPTRWRRIDSGASFSASANGAPT
ncbi:MAG TPA: hypothetical protein VM712_03535, partial [Gaiellales bacterium]|nr:hypothetical protein [Gaiellales bacterium]